jgi:hypothetical protein
MAVLLLACVPFALEFTTSSTTSVLRRGLWGPTIRDNVVSFPGASVLSFNLTRFSITDGQPRGNPPVTISGIDMHVEAGRHGSSKPAADFGAGLGVLNAMGLDTAWPHLARLPEYLNFCAIGTIEFTFASTGRTHQCDDIRVGQGHTGMDNKHVDLMQRTQP